MVHLLHYFYFRALLRDVPTFSIKKVHQYDAIMYISYKYIILHNKYFYFQDLKYSLILLDFRINLMGDTLNKSQLDLYINVASSRVVKMLLASQMDAQFVSGYLYFCT